MANEKTTTLDTSLNKQRSIAELGNLDSYTEMTDEEIERYTQWRIDVALAEQQRAQDAQERQEKAQAQIEYFQAQKNLAEQQLKILVEEQLEKAKEHEQI